MDLSMLEDLLALAIEAGLKLVFWVIAIVIAIAIYSALFGHI